MCGLVGLHLHGQPGLAQLPQVRRLWHDNHQQTIWAQNPMEFGRVAWSKNVQDDIGRIIGYGQRRPDICYQPVNAIT